MFTYPTTLVQQIRQEWQQHERLQDVSARLPSDKVISHLLEVAYHASLLPEEARQLRFRIVYCSKSDFEGASSPTRHALDQPPVPIVFTKHRDYNTEEIRRLAPATDYRRVAIAVAPEEHSGRLKIWGLIDASSFHIKPGRLESSSKFSTTKHLCLSSTEPGDLAVSGGDLTLIRLKQGHISRPVGLLHEPGPVNDFYAQAARELTETVQKNLRAKKMPAAEVDELASHYNVHRHVLASMITQIRDSLHGGLLVIVHDEVQHDDPRFTRVLKVKYPCDQATVWKLAVERGAAEWLHHFYNRQFSSRGHDEHAAEELSQYIKVKEAAERLGKEFRNATKFAAGLSGVDGAIVVSDRFRLLGFGAEVIASAPELSHVHASEDSAGASRDRLSIEMFGTRHRAAFRLCTRYADCVAFILSQDGGVKAVKKTNGRLLLWPDVSLEANIFAKA